MEASCPAYLAKWVSPKVWRKAPHIGIKPLCIHIYIHISPQTHTNSPKKIYKCQVNKKMLNIASHLENEIKTTIKCCFMSFIQNNNKHGQGCTITRLLSSADNFIQNDAAAVCTIRPFAKNKHVLYGPPVPLRDIPKESEAVRLATALLMVARG